jgi:hypothetical protein
MNTPIKMLDLQLPIGLINKIQGYLRNDIAHEAVREYLYYLEYQQQVYDDYIYNTQVQPNCYCHELCAKYLRKYDGCDYCRRFESDDCYKLPQYMVCFSDNEQCCKLR